jgi:DNA-directed RNA polymerase II subunit RPB2
MKKGAIDRGLFRSIIYKTYKTIKKKGKTYREEFARPEVKPGDEDKYRAIDSRGLPMIGSFVKEGDCLIGKIRRILATNKVENVSSFVEIKQEGVVDRVLVSTNAEGEQVVKVKIRQIRKPEIGDKFSSRYSQKGTVGAILPDEDMPFTAGGVSPDILLDPHAIPSRMTIGKLLEIVSSKVAAFSGERVNATAFRKFNYQEWMRNLKQYGFSPSGKERMYNGMTGKPIEALIFTGPCYYQALRHQVKDKIQMRARGGISQLTHQPVGGRKKGGGLRIGEMERDAIISHGASAFLRERLCLVSDPFETVFCSTCGTIAISNVIEDKYICRGCETSGAGCNNFSKIILPFSFKYLTQLLLGAGIMTKFNVGPQK